MWKRIEQNGTGWNIKWNKMEYDRIDQNIRQNRMEYKMEQGGI